MRAPLALPPLPPPAEPPESPREPAPDVTQEIAVEAWLGIIENHGDICWKGTDDQMIMNYQAVFQSYLIMWYIQLEMVSEWSF